MGDILHERDPANWKQQGRPGLGAPSSSWCVLLRYDRVLDRQGGTA